MYNAIPTLKRAPPPGQETFNPRSAPAAAQAPSWVPPQAQAYVNPRSAPAPAAAQAPSWVPPQAQAYVNPRVAPAAKLNTPFDLGTGSAYDGQLERYRAYTAPDVSESFKALKAQQAQERADAAVVLPVKPNYSALPQGFLDYVPAPVSGTNYSELPQGLTDHLPAPQATPVAGANVSFWPSGLIPYQERD